MRSLRNGYYYYYYHQLTHVHIHIDCSRNVSSKTTKFKILYLPYFLSDLQQIFTDLFEIFYSFY